jgi:hypothetical protein
MRYILIGSQGCRQPGTKSQLNQSRPKTSMSRGLNYQPQLRKESQLRFRGITFGPRISEIEANPEFATKDAWRFIRKESRDWRIEEFKS